MHVCGPGRRRRPGCAQAGPAELAVLYETGSGRLLRECNPLALSSSRRESVVGRTRMRGRGTTSSACGRRGGPAARSRKAPPGDRQETASGTPGLLQGPSSSWRWVGSCGLLSRELWRWGPSEMEELHALPLGVLEVGFAPGRRAAIFSPGGAGDRVHLGMGIAGSSTLAPPTGRKDAAVFFLW